MDRVLEYTIPLQFEGHKISEFLRNKRFSRQSLTTLRYQEGSIFLNDQMVHMNKLMVAGDQLKVIIREESSSEKIPPCPLPIDIVYEDEDIMVVNKPAGMPIHPSLNHYEDALANAVAYYFAEQGKPYIFRCINRLDRDTTGLTILAKHMVSCSILYDDMVQRNIHREYLAVVEGCQLEESGIIDMPLGRKPDSAIERIVDWENGDRAVTHFHVLGRIEEKNLSIVKLQLETGRTHQIRVHMKAIGHPLIGDFLYNPNNTMMGRQALHAWKLSFQHPITNERMEFTAEIPEDMKSIIDKTLTLY